jgi:two-component system sensor kinase FixL
MRLSNSRFIPRATTIGLVLTALLVFANAVVSEWNIERLLRNEHRVIDTQSLLTKLETVLSSMTQAETAERGFLITDDPNYLQTYRRAVENTGATLDILETQMAGDIRQEKRLAALRRHVDSRFEELRQAIAAQQTEGFTAAKLAVSTNRGRELMNEMRKLVAEMKDDENAALEERANESQQSALAAHATDVVGAILGIGMVGLAFVLFRRDLANRQRAEEATRRLAEIVECSEDAILRKTLDGIVVSWNAAAERLYGYKAEEMIGKSVTLLCPPERVEEVRLHLNHARLDKRIDHFETTRIRKDGERIEISLSISPIKDDNGNVIGVSAIARDMTERMRLQREVLEIAALEQRRIGQDLHDGTGQELTGLAMMAERLAGELATKKLPESKTAATIVDGLEEALSHVRALSKGLVPVEVDSVGLMIALSELASRTSDLHGVNCTFECDEPVCVLDNQTAMHLYRLSQEAVTNAIKHGRGRNILISLTDDTEFLTLKIEDDGRGFERTDEPSAGSGRIMRYRAELIGATLSIAAAEPTGTIITCHVPHRQPADQPVRQAEVAA